MPFSSCFRASFFLCGRHRLSRKRSLWEEIVLLKTSSFVILSPSFRHTVSEVESLCVCSSFFFSSNILQSWPCLVSLTGGYVYFETSYKAVNRVVSSAALEGGGGDLRIQVMDDAGNLGINPGNNINNSSSSALTSSSSTTSIFKQGLSVSNLDDSLASLLIVPNTGHIISTNISVTGPQGNCLTFFYNLDGLSAEKFRIMVKDLEADFNSNQTLWESSIESEGKWIRASVAYAYETTHQVRITPGNLIKDSDANNTNNKTDKSAGNEGFPSLRSLFFSVVSSQRRNPSSSLYPLLQLDSQGKR